MTYQRRAEVLEGRLPYSLLIEYSCLNCAGGFSSFKRNPRYCSQECYLEHQKENNRLRVVELWKSPTFVAKIQAARSAAGYPDPNTPAAVARRRLRIVVKRNVRRSLFRLAKPKTTGSYEILGYTSDQLRARIESLFKAGMTWSNYGEWEIDHIRPVSSFALSATVAEINALDNLQPLWKLENRKKWCHVQ